MIRVLTEAQATTPTWRVVTPQHSSPKKSASPESHAAFMSVQLLTANNFCWWTSPVPPPD